MSTEEKQLSEVDSFLYLLQKDIFTDFAGPKLLKMRYIINFFKGATFLWVLYLMNIYNNYTPGMYLYLFLHGSYGIFWIAKDLIFPDPRFNQKASFGSCILSTIFLYLYWMIPIPLAAGLGISEPSTQRIFFLVLLYISGLVLMMGSDCQKYFTLKKRPGLISTGFFKLTRNPNYLGEIMIYNSFVLCSGHSLGFLVFYGLAVPVFALNIYLKDKTSYCVKKGWEDYKDQSYIILPKVTQSLKINIALYLTIFTFIVLFLLKESPASFSNFQFSYVLSKQMISEDL